jgi:alpha-mannosidase
LILVQQKVELLVQGDVVTGNWPKELALNGSRIFSYVLNNYWNTNYKASQGGKISFRYSITSQSVIKKEDAYRLGWEIRQPLYGHRISFQDFRETKAPYNLIGQSSLAVIDNELVALTTMKKAKWADGWLIRLQEISGEIQTTNISLPGKYIVEAWQMDLLERDIHPLEVKAEGSLTVKVPAWGLSTVRIVLEKSRDGKNEEYNK